MPAPNAYVFEHKAQQLLAACEVERADADHGPLGEVGDAVLEAVTGGQLGFAGDEGLAFLVEATRPSVDLS